MCSFRSLDHWAALLCAALLAAAVSCSDDDPAPRPVQPAFLGVYVNHRGAEGIDPNLAEAYLNVAQGEFACAQFDLQWGEVEPYAGVRLWQEVDMHAHQAVRRGMPLSIQVLLLDHQTRGSIPSDLIGRNWDDPTLRARLAIFLWTLHERLKPNSAYIWLGRDVDAYFVQNEGELDPFIGLFQAVRESLRVQDIETPLGLTVSYGESLLDQRLDIADYLAPHLDRLGLTVYGRDLDYEQSQNPEQTMARMREAVGRFPESRVVITETSYPGFEDEGRSQEEFARLLTDYLAYPPSNLAGAIWFCLHDWHGELAEDEAFHRFAGEPDRQEAYASQLGRLGLRQVSGVPRPAWYKVQEWNRAAARTKVAGPAAIVR